MELKNIISKVEDVQNEVLDYIVSTEHYIFNWIYDKEVQEFIEEYPDNYEDRIYLLVIDTSIAPTIKIYFEDHPKGVEYIERAAYLPTFKDFTKVRWMEWNGKVKEKQILEKEKQLEYYKEQLERTKEELEKLKKNNNI
jgi:hypothetical protein